MALFGVALAAGAAAWIADLDPIGWVFAPAPPSVVDAASFDARFLRESLFDEMIAVTPPPVARALPPELEAKLRQARARLAQDLTAQTLGPPDLVATPSNPPSNSVVAVPLPRSRPVVADAMTVPRSTALSNDPQPGLLEKFSEMFSGRLTLASLDPDGGLGSDGPNLTALGYESGTAVYDISARRVYMPNGVKLEAHSGFGALMDDPGHVDKHNVGATPPNVYELKPRERLFHGVQAIRMIPVGSGDTMGRSGLLAHSYMLGPNGDSNGCVSIKQYDRFLQAYQNGEIKRLVVVPSLGDTTTLARRSTSQL
ncbi:MAG TPA: DUF2778 domain-containing protein [Rhodopseudomonas sp.]|uniref:DUF2778 domain-containing protein n=1 Tax=Rhodopseudomonas sp. TaxID=1078 RepID=UPI002ED838FE